MVNFKRKKKIAVEVSNKLREYYKSQSFCDFNLYVGDATIKCHKVILAAVSPYFEKWLKRDEECGRNVTWSSFYVSNCSFEQIKAIIDCVYTGHFSLKKKSDLNALIKKANGFEIKMNEEMLEVVEKATENRPNSAELMPPPPQPQQSSSSQAVRSSRFEDLLGADDNDVNVNENESDEMDAFLPFSQFATQRPSGNNGETNDDTPGDEFLPFSQMTESNGNDNNTLTEPKTPKKIKCDVPGCRHSFSKEREMLNHKRKYHEKKNFKCPVVACKKKFERGKMFADHMKEKHSDYVKERRALRHQDADSSIINGTPEHLEVKPEFDNSDNSQDIFK